MSTAGGVEPLELLASVKVNAAQLVLLIAETLPVMKTTKNPYLSLRVEQGFMQLTAGNPAMAVVVVSTEMVKVKTPGEFHLLGGKLHRILGKATGQHAAMCLVGGTVTVESGSRRWTLGGSTGLMPVGLQSSPDDYLEIKAAGLAEAASSLSEVGRRLKFKPGQAPSVAICEGKIRVTATHVHHEHEVPGLDGIACTLGWSDFLLLDSMLTRLTFDVGDALPVRFAFEGDELHAWQSGRHLRLPAAASPANVEPWVAKALHNDEVLHVDRRELRDAVEAVTVNQSEATVTLSLTANKLRVTSNSVEGTGSDELLVGWEFNDMSAQFKVDPLLGVLRAHGAPGLEVRVIDVSGAPADAWVFVGAGRRSVLRQSS